MPLNSWNQWQWVNRGDRGWTCIRCSVKAAKLLNRYHGFVSTTSLLSEEESSQMRTVGLIQAMLSITPNCLPLSPLVCHSNFLEGNVEKNVLGIRGSVASVMCDSSRKLRGVQLFPLNTKDSGITSRLQHTSSWRKQPELSTTSLTPRSHPPKPATAYPNYPAGIENSTGPCLLWKGRMWNIAYRIRRHWRLLTQNRSEFKLCEATEPQTSLSFVKYGTLKTASPLAALIIYSWRGGRKIWQRCTSECVCVFLLGKCTCVSGCLHVE